MAIYHLHVKVIGRKSGSSAVASAAYRSASRLRDERIERSHDFSSKRGVIHSEVLLPENAPEHWSDRERLWNDVEAFEVRKDAQLAREVEFALPREMSEAQGIELARDFVQAACLLLLPRAAISPQRLPKQANDFWTLRLETANMRVVKA